MSPRRSTPPSALRQYYLSTVITDVIEFPREGLGGLLKFVTKHGLNILGIRFLGDWWIKGLLIGRFVVAIMDGVPFLKRYLDTARAFLDNFFDSLALRLTGQLHGFNHQPKGSLDCPGQLPISQKVIWLALGEGQSAPRGGVYWSIPRGTDITYHIRELVEEFAPIVYEFDDEDDMDDDSFFAQN